MVGGHEWHGGDDHAWCGMVRSRVVNGDNKHGMVGGHSFWAWPKKIALWCHFVWAILKEVAIILPLFLGFIPDKVLIFILFYFFIKNIHHYLPFKQNLLNKYLKNLTNKNRRRKLLIFYMLWL
jgi:hypothetical protein